LFKELAYRASKWMAHLLLRWSDYWGDIAESMHSGEPISEIKKRRKMGDNHDDQLQRSMD
jgi:hypothetical protein